MLKNYVDDNQTKDNNESQNPTQPLNTWGMDSSGVELNSKKDTSENRVPNEDSAPNRTSNFVIGMRAFFVISIIIFTVLLTISNQPTTNYASQESSGPRTVASGLSLGDVLVGYSIVILPGLIIAWQYLKLLEQENSDKMRATI